MVDASKPAAYPSGVEPRPDDSRGTSAGARQDEAVTAVSSVAYGFMGSQAL
jgi:hypothetical protein